MEYPLYNQNGENVGRVDLPAQIFGLDINNDLLHQVVISQMANKRQVIAHAKGRGEVRGGGKKPWRQKGTGRARHGSIRSPIWKGGGVTFGPTKERNFKKKLNKKVARKGLLMALSSKTKDNQLFIVDAIKLEQPKTKEMALFFNKMSKLFESKNTNTLLAVSVMDEKLRRSSKNLATLDAVEARNLNALQVLSYKYLILSKDSINVLEKLSK